mgnify:CR=1 FL=1
MKKTLFTATLLAASLMAASTVQAAPQEVTMWHYFDQKPEQEMLADMVEEYNSLQDDIHINATFVSRTELMNQYTVGALSGELPDIGQVDSPDMESYISLGVFEDITNKVPIGVPTPPERSVPPITAEEIASISRPFACSTKPAQLFKQNRKPPSPARKPSST